MAYTEGYKIDYRSGGDTVSAAIGKHISEITRIYGILNELKNNDLTAAEIETLKTGSISGSRITGNINASQVSGVLSSATIAAGKVTGLESALSNFMGSLSDIRITEGAPGYYIKLSNGLIIQWGNADFMSPMKQIDVTFSCPYTQICNHVFLTVQTLDNNAELVSSTLKGRPSKTGFTALVGNASSNISSFLLYLAIGV